MERLFDTREDDEAATPNDEAATYDDPIEDDDDGSAPVPRGFNAWVGAVKTRYRNASRPDLAAVAFEVARYVARRGGLNDDQRDDIVSVCMVQAISIGEVILQPRHWARRTAKLRLLEYRRDTGLWPTRDPDVPWNPKTQKAITDDQLRDEIKRRAAEELEAGTSSDDYRRKAVTMIRDGYMPDDIDWTKHTAARVIADLAKRLKRKGPTVLEAATVKPVVRRARADVPRFATLEEYEREKRLQELFASIAKVQELSAQDEAMSQESTP